MDTVTKKKHRLTVTTLAALAVVLLFSTVALARYIHQAVLNDYIVTAGEDFYFTSDLLVEPDGPDTSDTPVYRITQDWENSQEAILSLELRNFQDPLHISDCEITYTVTAEPGNTLDGTIPPGGVESGEGNCQTVELTVPKPENINQPLEVLVTAETTEPYRKTLQGLFIISPAVSYQMAQNAGEPVAVFSINLAPDIVSTRNVLISWEAGAVPDMTNPIVINANPINLNDGTLTTTLNTGAIYQLVFFKDNAGTNYTGVTASVPKSE